MAAEVHFNSMSVQHAASACSARHQRMADSMASVIETAIADTASILHQAGDASKVEELGEAVRQLIAARHQVVLHGTALQETQLGYSMTAEATDFEQQLSQRVEQLAAHQRYDPARDELYLGFEEAVGLAAEGGEEQIDDDIAIEGGANQLAPNEKCPISGKPLLELSEPVMDSKGFVYEKAAMEQWLCMQHGAQTKCPVAGTTHTVRQGELRPATKVLKAQKRAKRAGATQQQTQEEDVLDVE